MSDLNQRIVDAISAESPTSGDMVALLADIREEGEKLATEREAVFSQSVDPLTTAEEVVKLRAHMSDLDHFIARNQTAYSRVKLVKEAAEYREEQSRLTAAYDEAVEEVASAHETMTAIEMNFRSGIKRAIEAEAKALAVNASLPDGAEPIAIPENISPERIIERESVLRWCHDGTNRTFDFNPDPGLATNVQRWFLRETFSLRGSVETHTRYRWDREKNKTPANQMIHGDLTPEQQARFGQPLDRLAQDIAEMAAEPVVPSRMMIFGR